MVSPQHVKFAVSFTLTLRKWVFKAHQQSHTIGCWEGAKGRACLEALISEIECAESPLDSVANEAQGL
jgi:hypothetical protein